MPSLLLSLISWLVPVAIRARWCEEWRAELRHGGWRMLPGALPDALALRRIDRENRHRMRGKRAGLWHAVDQDVRYAVRSSVSAPGFTLAVVGSLAIGIGATTAAFTSVNAVLFRPFPKIHGQEKLVTVRIAPWKRVWFPTSWNDYEVLRDGMPALAELSIAHDTTFAVARSGAQEPQQALGLVVSGNYFDVLGVRPARGRFFRPEEDGTPRQQPALVISHRYWQRQMAGDSAVLQRTLIVNGTDLPIIGVAPEGFGGVLASGDPQLWITFALSDLVFRDATGRPVHARGSRSVFHVACGTPETWRDDRTGVSPGRRSCRRPLRGERPRTEATIRSGRATAPRGASAVLAVCRRLDVGTADRPRHRLRERGQPPAGARDQA